MKLERFYDISSEVNEQTEHTKNFFLPLHRWYLAHSCKLCSQLDMQIRILKICICIAMLLAIATAIMYSSDQLDFELAHCA